MCLNQSYNVSKTKEKNMGFDRLNWVEIDFKNNNQLLLKSIFAKNKLDLLYSFDRMNCFYSI